MNGKKVKLIKKWCEKELKENPNAITNKVTLDKFFNYTKDQYNKRKEVREMINEKN